MSESSQQSESAAQAEQTEYKRTTLYLRGWVKKDYERWFSMLELDLLGCDSSVVEQSEKREMHEALIATAMSNPDEFIEHLNTRRSNQEAFKVEVESLLP